MLKPGSPITLYWDTLSGHSHRVQLFLSLAGLPFDIRQIDLRSGQHKQPAYLAINPLGKLPAIDDSGTIVHDSNAILTYLAAKYDDTHQWLPADSRARAEIARYLSFAAGPVEFSAADARLINVFGGRLDPAACQRIADKHFPMLDRALADDDFLLGRVPTIADVANYTYIAHAPEGGISLAPYPGIRAWLARIEALPGFVPMQRTAVGLHVGA